MLPTFTPQVLILPGISSNIFFRAKLKSNQIATVRGVDIFPPPVTWMPPNCVFEVDDVLREWTWREPFDFIHLRLMYGAFDPAGWEKVYKQAFE